MPNQAEHYRPLMRLLIRLMGVFFVIDGTAALIGHGTDLWSQVKYMREVGMPFANWYALGWTVSGGFILLAGLLLIFKSSIAMDALYYERLQDPTPPEVAG